MNGEHMEIVLSPEPTTVARLSTDADSRISVSTETMSNALLGQPFHAELFRHVSGEIAVKSTLVEALRAPFRQ